MSEEKKDLKIKLKDDKGKYYEVISTEQFNIQEELNKEIEINIKYKIVLDKIKNNNKRIIEYGFDYDGFNNVEDLKKLIDMLVDYARKNNELLEEIE